MSNEAMIQLRQLKMAFGSKVILDNLDLDVRQGETLAVIGPSGTGKSTIIKLLTGLLPPASGSIVIDGQEVSSFTEDEWDGLRQHMGVVFQYSALFDFLSVGENVAFGLRRHFKLPEEEIQERVGKLLEMVGMPNTQHMLPAELSGGMKKRVGPGPGNDDDHQQADTQNSADAGSNIGFGNTRYGIGILCRRPYRYAI